MYVAPTGHEYWNSQYVDGDAFPYLGPAYDVDFAGGAVMNGLVRPLYNMSSGAINDVWNVHRYGMFESDLQAFCFLSLMPEAQGALGSFGKSVGTIWDGLASRLSFASKNAVTVKSGKWDYFFGRVTSNPHNQLRSLQNLKDLTALGFDEASGGQKALMQVFEQGKNLPEAARHLSEHGVTITRTIPI